MVSARRGTSALLDDLRAVIVPWLTARVLLVAGYLVAVATADRLVPDGKPTALTEGLIAWDGTKWSGYDVPDIAPNAKPDVVGPFIMNQEGTARLFVRGLMRDGPFPVHYEPFEAPIANVIAPKIRGNPVARAAAMWVRKPRSCAAREPCS